MASNMPFFRELGSNVKSNARLKKYPLGQWEILVCDRAIFGGDGWEAVPNKWDSASPKGKKKRGETPPTPESLKRSRRRAASKIRDIALCNPFRWFVTLTLSAERVDRYDINAALRRMRVWLDNRVRRKGLVYVLIPEHHKDGAIHFHGFFNDVDVGIVDSGTIRVQGEKKPKKPRSSAQRREWLALGGQPVYNITDWNLGFSTAIEIYGDYEAAISYACKYLDKQYEGIDGSVSDKIGGRWYYSGGDIKTPLLSFVLCDLREIEAAGGFVFHVEEAGLSFCVLRGRAEPEPPTAATAAASGANSG